MPTPLAQNENSENRQAATCWKVVVLMSVGLKMKNANHGWKDDQNPQVVSCEVCKKDVGLLTMKESVLSAPERVRQHRIFNEVIL